MDHFFTAEALFAQVVVAANCLDDRFTTASSEQEAAILEQLCDAGLLTRARKGVYTTTRSVFQACLAAGAKHAMREVFGQPPRDPLPLGWWEVEILGHRRVVGRLSEVRMAGTPFIRVERPATSLSERFILETEISPRSIFERRPATEESARGELLQGECADAIHQLPSPHRLSVPIHSEIMNWTVEQRVEVAKWAQNPARDTAPAVLLVPRTDDPGF